MKQIGAQNLMTQVVQQLDAAFAQVGHSKRKAHLFHDIVIFCKTRYSLRNRVKQVYRILDQLKLKLAYSKTLIGKAQKGFDCLGYKIETGQDSVSLSETSVQRFRTRLRRLDEHRASTARVARYVTRWCRWAISGLRDLSVKIPSFILNLINNPDNLESQTWPAH